MRECIDCSQSFSPFVHNQQRCPSCVTKKQLKDGKHKHVKQKRFNKRCEWCGTKFEMTGPASRFCCYDCKNQNKHAKVYNLSRKEYLALVSKTKCDICNSEGFFINPNYNLKFVVDHCHTSGMVRGWLCHNCNRALGLFQDNIETMEKAIAYLKSATTIPKGSTLKRVEAHDTEM